MTQATILARLVTNETLAQKIADALSELFEPEELAASAFEMPEADALPTSVPRPQRQEHFREGAMGTLALLVEPEASVLHGAVLTADGGVRHGVL